MQPLLARLFVLRQVFESPQLRRLELSWGGYYIGEWTHFVALSVYAYKSGGASALGVFGLVRMLPAAAALPLGSVLVDRYPRQRVLLAIYLARALVLGAAAATLATGGSRVLVFALAALAACAAAPFRPSVWALLPQLARTPQELVGANVASSVFEGFATLVGPALAGGLLEVMGSDGVVAASAGVYLWCAFLMARVHREGEPEVSARLRASEALREALGGFRTLAREPHPRLVVGLLDTQPVVRGMLNVLLVVAAVQLLGLGDPGVGFLNSAFGGGALVGALAAVALVGRRRLAYPFLAGLAAWGAPIALVGAWTAAPWALFCLVLVGAGNSVLDVSGITLLQRSVDDAVLGRVFGVVEILALAGIGIGSVLASLMVSELGARGALVVAGAILPALAIAFRRRVRAIDESVSVPERELALVASTPIFAPLAVTTLEKLASRLRPVSVAAGEKVVEQGGSGDLFYLIAAGEVEVSHDGEQFATLGPGEYFGEIALLRDVQRVATCTAATDLELYALERDVFLSAVTGHTRSTARAEDVVTERLGTLQARRRRRRRG